MFKLLRYFSLTGAVAVVAVSAVLLFVYHRGAVNVREWIYEPLFSTKSTGLGLRLSISRSIIEAHGERLWVASESRNGTGFRYSLPVTGETTEQ
jgi:C4-dicarboxylate-specific signal transduction histidine kinase